MIDNKSREAFEEWYGYYGFSSDWSEEHGCYQDKQTQFMFAAWQASESRILALLESGEVVTKAAQALEAEFAMQRLDAIDGKEGDPKPASHHLVETVLNAIKEAL